MDKDIYEKMFCFFFNYHGNISYLNGLISAMHSNVSSCVSLFPLLYLNRQRSQISTCPQRMFGVVIIGVVSGSPKIHCKHDASS